MAKIIRITESQLKEFVKNNREVFSENKNKKKDFTMDYVKANRKGRREEERERYGNGFKSTTRIAKSNKNYSRKGKNKFSADFSDED